MGGRNDQHREPCAVVILARPFIAGRGVIAEANTRRQCAIRIFIMHSIRKNRVKHHPNLVIDGLYLIELRNFSRIIIIPNKLLMKKNILTLYQY